MALILLQHLHGVGPLEWAIAQMPRPRTSSTPLGREPDASIEERAADLSVYLFGIDEYDTDEIDEVHFEPVERMMRDESDAYWARHGWDVTGDNGKQLAVMAYLLRPMVCLVERLHPDARYTQGADSWAKQLEEDARRFRPSR